MPKTNIGSGLNNETHSSSSKKWFTKISLKIPKKLKNGKSASTLTNALNASKKNNNNTLNIPSPLSKQCNPDTSLSNQTICDSNENVSISSGSFLNNKDGLSTQSSQLTINTTKNEATTNEDTNLTTPIICISPSDIEPLNTQFKNLNIHNLTSSSSTFSGDINRSNATRSPSPRMKTHFRFSSDQFNTPIQRPRSYSDTPVPVHPSILYNEDDFVNENKSYEAPRNSNHVEIKLGKENYYHFANNDDNHTKNMNTMDMDIYDMKTPILSTQSIHTTHSNNSLGPADLSNLTSPSNTISGKVGSNKQSTSVATTPVLKRQDNYYNQDSHSFITKTTPTPDRKLIGLIESMQNQKCEDMTAKEFALAVGIDINSTSDSSDDEDDEGEDKNSVCTLSSTLSQLTANGKVPTADEIYNALSIKSLGRQRRKHSAPILNLEMFIPPTPGECQKSGSCNQSIKSNVSGASGKSFQQRVMEKLNHKVSNPKLEKRLPPFISTTNKSNESGSTYVANANANTTTITTNLKSSYPSSIHSSHSGNTTTYMSDLPENDYDSYCSCSSYLQQSMINNGAISFDNIGKNNITTTFYSLPRVKFHSSCSSNNNNSSPIIPSKSTNSIPTSNIHISNYNNTYRDMGGMGMVCNGRRHSRVASSISGNSQSSKKVSPPSPSFPINHSNPMNTTTTINANAKLNSNAITSINASKINNNTTTNINTDHHNMYINSKTIAITNVSSTVTSTPSPTTPNICSTSWSNGLSDIDNLRLAGMSANKTKPSKPVEILSKSHDNITSTSNIKVYTKGRFTITHEHYNHKRSSSTHKFQIEKN